MAKKNPLGSPPGDLGGDPTNVAAPHGLPGPCLLLESDPWEDGGKPGFFVFYNGSKVF